MQDAWRAYLEMALGLTEAPRKKAQKVATELLTKGGATAGQLQGLVEDLMSTGVANREALTNIVRYEVDRALGRVGLATADEVSELTSRVRDLEKQLRAAQARADAVQGGSGAGDAGELTIAEPGPVAVVPPAKKAVVKKAVAKKAAKSTPNAMPAAATTDTPARAAKAGPAKKATPATTGPAKDAPQKAVPAKATKVAKAARAAGGSTEPAGTAAAPTAPVKAAAAETVLPPAGASGAPARKAAKKSAPAKKAAGTQPSSPEASS